jgi:hypothetical protein
MSLETVSMMDDCQEVTDELHTIRQEWDALVRDMDSFIRRLRDPQFGPVAMRADIADQLEDIMVGE